MAKRQPTHLVRLVQILAVKLEFHDSVSVIECRGRLDEPIRKIYEINISLRDAREEDVGPSATIVVAHLWRSNFNVEVRLPARDFDRAWVLATGGMLKHASLTMTKPHRTKVQVLDLSFSSEPDAER
jgi:hypothetical protein